MRLHVAHGALKYAATNDAGLVPTAVIVEAVDLAYAVRDVRRLRSGAAWAPVALRECGVVSDALDLSFKADMLVAHAMDLLADEPRWDSGLVQANILALSGFQFRDQFTRNPLRSTKLRERVARALSARASELEALPSDVKRIQGLAKTTIHEIVGSKGREPFRASEQSVSTAESFAGRASDTSASAPASRSPACSTALARCPSRSIAPSLRSSACAPAGVAAGAGAGTSIVIGATTARV